MDTNSKTHFPYDAIIVLGSPCTPNGRPAPEQRERVLEGVRQFLAGAAPLLIMCGGAVHTEFNEADSMAHFAHELGVPSNAIIKENKSRMTVENIIFSAKILRDLGYKDALIISSPTHIKRIIRITNYLNTVRPDLKFNYSTKPCPWPKEFSRFWKILLHINEWNLNRKPLPKHRFFQNLAANTLS